ASSSDFFAKAAEAVVNLVGLDAGSVLRYDRGEWRVEVLHLAKHALQIAGWQPSRSILSKVQKEKRTFWQVPSHRDTAGTSLLGIQAAIAAPILNMAGEVIGALYGDCRQDSMLANSAPIAKVQATMVELLAMGVAAGLTRLEQEQAAVAARVQFEQFFTPELARQLALQPDLLHGKEAEVTLLFCDIRGFSRISERLGPAQTVAWISDLMTALSRCVQAHRGVLVDYIGDELLAMWGAPEKPVEPARLACRAALEMLATLPALNERWQAILQEPIQIGIGVNMGKAWVGNTGSKHKFKYGPLGNTVNLASRVQGATKYLGCPILITHNTEAQLEGTFETRRLATVRVINIAEPVGLYELTAPGRADSADKKQKYELALEAFEQGKFRETARLLGTLLADHPDDAPAVVLMSRAVQALMDDPRQFDPVWILPGK
ncbi:MAG TPA: adenylate/guanylate cyclase domain-containing protein, partial [Gemmataceae bacterium]|nr:adenylate/guanylate cyclase domain-containing protein [Gemmataceae bacterium]